MPPPGSIKANDPTDGLSVGIVVGPGGGTIAPHGLVLTLEPDLQGIEVSVGGRGSIGDVVRNAKPLASPCGGLAHGEHARGGNEVDDVTTLGRGLVAPEAGLRSSKLDGQAVTGGAGHVAGFPLMPLLGALREKFPAEVFDSGLKPLGDFVDGHVVTGSPHEVGDGVLNVLRPEPHKLADLHELDQATFPQVEQVPWRNLQLRRRLLWREEWKSG